MINKTELRIGNKVLLGNDIVTVKEIGEFELSFDDGKFLFTYDRFAPIKLSPSLLEACGFEQDNGSEWGGWLSPDINGEQFRIRLDESFYFTPGNLSNPIHMHYVHQLQKLVLCNDRRLRAIC